MSSLWDTIQSRQSGNVDFLCPGMLKQIHTSNFSSSKVDSTQAACNNAPVSITYTNSSTKDSHKISTHLLVGADGGNSSVRTLLGIPSFQSQYGRRAVTCTVRMSGSLQQTAFQRFFPSGPIALLPVWSNESKDEPIYANIVWSTTPDHATHLKNLSTAEFLKEINLSLQVGPTQSPPLMSSALSSILPSSLENAIRGTEKLVQSMNSGLTMSQWSEDPFHTYFLIPPKVTEVIGPRLSFDLKLSQADQYVAGGGPTSSRVVLVGDAAHTFHPMVSNY